MGEWGKPLAISPIFVRVCTVPLDAAYTSFWLPIPQSVLHLACCRPLSRHQPYGHRRMSGVWDVSPEFVPFLHHAQSLSLVAISKYDFSYHSWIPSTLSINVNTVSHRLD